MKRYSFQYEDDRGTTMYQGKDFYPTNDPSKARVFSWRESLRVYHGYPGQRVPVPALYSIEEH